MRPRSIQRYGWRPQLPDQRDKAFKDVHAGPLASVPPEINLKPKLALVFDQGALGSCTANASCWAWQFERGPAPDGGPWSRMFLYVESLIAEGTYPQDAGAEIRDVIKVLASIGVPPDSAWPYAVAGFPSMPPETAETGAQGRVPTYSALQTKDDRLECLASGHPFVFGFTVYDSFESDTVAATGLVPMPTATEQTLGGHAVTAVGYFLNHPTAGECYLVQNSWGSSWGCKDEDKDGCFLMPCAYVENPNLASDFWTVRA